MRQSKLFLSVVCLTEMLRGQEWRSYGNDAGGSRYSPLKQINRQNVAQLKPAWTYNTGDVSDGTTLKFAVLLKLLRWWITG